MTSSTPAAATYDYASIEEAFPNVDSGLKPFGNRVLVQVRLPKRMSKGGIVLTHETRDTDQWNAQIAKVIAIGPTAFKNQDTLQAWPEGDWAKPGDFVRVPKYAGDRFEVRLPGSDEKVLFVVFKDNNLIGAQIGNPLDVISFI